MDSENRHIAGLIQSNDTRFSHSFSEVYNRHRISNFYKGSSKMNEQDRKQRLYVAQQGEKVRKGDISRREFLRRAATAGFGLSAAGMMRMEAAARTVAAPKYAREIFAQADDMNNWLKTVGSKFKGTTVRLSSESTAPSQLTSGLIADNFTALTGIEVQWEQTPLDQVLAKITQDTATENASNDIYYLSRFHVVFNIPHQMFGDSLAP